MKIEEVIKPLNIEEKERKIRKIPQNIKEILEVMGIPEDEWFFLTGLGEKIPGRYQRLKNYFIHKGIEFKELPREKSSSLHVIFPEGKRIMEEALFLSCLSRCAIQPHKNLEISFARGSQGTVVIGSPIPKLFSTNLVKNSIRINVEEGSSADIALLFSYDTETSSRTEVEINMDAGASLIISGVIFNPGKDTGIHWSINMKEKSTVQFDEIGFLLSPENYRGSWTDLFVRGKKVSASLNSADFALGEGESRVVYLAKIFKGNSGAEVIINSYSMDFSRGAKKGFLPGFYTEEDDVILQHSAGSAQFTPQKIEYMKSRGLTNKDISKIFIDSVLEKTVYRKLPAEFTEEMSNYTRYLLNRMEIIV